MLCTTQIVQRPLRTGASVQRVYQFVIRVTQEGCLLGADLL